MRRLLLGFTAGMLAIALLLLAGALWWLHAPMALNPPAGSQVLDLEIEPGTPPRQVAADVAASGAHVWPLALYAWFRFSGQARQIKAGNYEITADMSPKRLLSMLVRGEEALRSVTLPEGLNFQQVLTLLRKAELVKPDTLGLSPAQIMERLGRPGVHSEGRFFPDTYTYAKGASDLAILQRAARAMDKRLAEAWAQRQSELPLRSAEEALILASIVEKETGKPADRPLISSVFHNRLRMGMMLQTDPTVIYGLGERFDGNLRKKDLLADTPYNTYTRAGLPPTPIAMPGKAALLAAVQPARTKALYFVAKGDGSSHFSSSLDEHNQAVGRYILRRQ